MPFYKTTHNIFKEPWNDELFDETKFNQSNLSIYIPPNKEWDYKRKLHIEDVEIWEVIYEASGGIGVYASHEPYAEFYMIRVGWDIENSGHGVETYYGSGAMVKVKKRMDELNIPYATHKMWVDNDKMYLYAGEKND
jgi:hypothetical protein